MAAPLKVSNDGLTWEMQLFVAVSWHILYVFWLKLALLDPKIVSTDENVVSSSSGRRFGHLEISKIPGFLFRGSRRYYAITSPDVKLMTLVVENIPVPTRLLKSWGFSSDPIEVYRPIVTKSSVSMDRICLKFLTLCDMLKGSKNLAKTRQNDVWMTHIYPEIIRFRRGSVLKVSIH